LWPRSTSGTSDSPCAGVKPDVLSTPFFPGAARYARESTPDCKGPPRDGPHFPCPSSRCQTARSAASDRAARLVPAARLCVRVLSPFRFISAFSSSPPHLRSVLPLRRAEPVARRQRQVPPQNEGQAERREAQCLNVSRSYGATSRLRGVSRPAQPGRRLSALHRGVAGPGTRCVSGVAAGDGAKARRRPLVMAGCGPGVSNPRLRAAFDATPRSAVRIVSGRRPS